MVRCANLNCAIMERKRRICRPRVTRAATPPRQRQDQSPLGRARFCGALSVPRPILALIFDLRFFRTASEKDRLRGPAMGVSVDKVRSSTGLTYFPRFPRLSGLLVCGLVAGFLVAFDCPARVFSSTDNCCALSLP
jgi:hypothetical protein